jgi:class 3 adenylate cyclase/tetratricopeptide (TPR) repeat protein
LASGTPASAPIRGAERRQLTVLFCDLVEAVRLAATLDPEDWRDVILAYQDACSRVVSRFDGHVAQYLGDGVLVYFGYPNAHEDDAERAVRAGLDVIAAMRAVNLELERRHGVRLELRIGIHTGPVVVSDMGGDTHRETLALGSTTNVAERIQKVATPGTVVVSRATLRLLRHGFVSRDLGEQELRGVGRVELHEVLRPVDRRNREESPARTPQQLIGRDRELAVLKREYARARSSDSRTVLLTGEAGIGKSRLIEALRHELALGPPSLLEGRCSPYAQNRPFHPVTEILQEHLGLAEEDTDEARFTRLARRLSFGAGAPPQSVPLIASLLGLDASAGEVLELSAPLRRERTFEALTAWALGLPDGRPFVLVIEDLHWADASSLELLGRWIRHARGAGLLLLLTAREFTPPWPADGTWVHLPLERLGRDEAYEIAVMLSPDRPLPPATLEAIVERSDGNPLYVEEITKEVLESGVVASGPGRIDVVDPRTVSIPATLQDSLMARLDRLGDAKGVAQSASIIGREFSFALLRAVSSTPLAALRTGLARLVEVGLVFERGSTANPTYLFKHALVQDAAYASLLRSARQPLHAAIAAALEEGVDGERHAAAADLLAYHYDRAGLHARAAPYYRRAGDDARARGSFTEALALYQRGVALTRRLPAGPDRNDRELALQLELAPTLHAAHGLATEEIHQAWERVHVLCGSGDDPGHLGLALRGLMIFNSGQLEFDKTHALGLRLLELGERTGNDQHLLSAHSGLGVSRFWRGDLRSAVQHFDRALSFYDAARHAELAERLGIDQRVESSGFLGWALWILGKPEQATARIEAAVEHGRSLSHRYSTAYGFMLASVSYMTRDIWDAAAHYSGECVAYSERYGFPLFRGVAIGVRAVVQASTRGDDTIGTVVAGLAEASGTGQKAGTPGMLSMLARVHKEMGRAKEAHDVIDSALRIALEGGQHFYDAELLRMKGELLMEDRPDDADSVLRGALARARQQEARGFELRIATNLAELLRRRGDRSEALALLAPIHASFDEGGDTPDVRRARELLQVLGATEDVQPA